jgi:TRAP-type uncharacterized transport system substrate-binding protein
VFPLREAKQVFMARSQGRGIAARNFLQANWHLATIGVTAVAAFCGAALLLNTMPPRAITMATGPESSGFQMIGKQYQAALERAGERLRVVETAGDIENLALLRDPNSGVKVALIQDGTIGKDEGTDLESLGTLFYEPVWIFLGSEVRELTPTACAAERFRSDR